MTQSTQATSVLRQRMIEDMRMRKLSPKTQSHYIRAVRQLGNGLLSRQDRFERIGGGVTPPNSQRALSLKNASHSMVVFQSVIRIGIQG